MHLDLDTVKKWLRIEPDMKEDDDLIRDLIDAAKVYLIEATGKEKFGKQTNKAELFCKFLIVDWYENRTYDNRTPMATRKPVLTSIIMQLKFGGEGDG